MLGLEEGFEGEGYMTCRIRENVLYIGGSVGEAKNLGGREESWRKVGLGELRI